MVVSLAANPLMLIPLPLALSSLPWFLSFTILSFTPLTALIHSANSFSFYPLSRPKKNLLHFFLTWTGHSLSMKKAWRFLMQMVAEEMQFDYNWRITLWITTNKPKKALNITQTISMGKLNPQKLDNNKVQQVQTKKTKESQSWIITIIHPDMQDRLHHLTLAKLFWLLKGCVYSTPQ
jgi:hypothetical protein